jgi:ABC-type transport system substrate-binding protein
MKRPSIFALNVILLLGFVPPLQSASDRPKQGGTLTLGIRTDLLLSNPFVNQRSTQGRIMDLIYEPLLGIDLRGKIQPGLVESWEVSRDGKVYTFRLRNGVKYRAYC